MNHQIPASGQSSPTKWRSEDLDREIIALNSKITLTLGDFCTGLLAIGRSGSGMISSLGFVGRALMEAGLGWFGQSADSAGMQRQVQMAYDAGRIDDVVILGPRGATQYHFDVRLPDNSLRGIDIQASQVSFLDCELAEMDKPNRYRMDDLSTFLIETLKRTGKLNSEINTVLIHEVLRRSLLNTQLRYHRVDLNIVFERLSGMKGEVKGLKEFLLSFRRLISEPLFSTLFEWGNVSLADIRGGKIFISGLPLARAGEGGLIAGILLKRMVQQVIERTSEGRGVVLWSESGQHYTVPEDQLFREVARSKRAVEILSILNLPALVESFGEAGRAAGMKYAGTFANTLLFKNSDAETICTLRSGSSGKYFYAILRDGNLTSLRNGGEGNRFLVDAIFHRFQTGSFKNKNPFTKVLFHEERGVVEHSLISRALSGFLDWSRFTR